MIYAEIVCRDGAVARLGIFSTRDLARQCWERVQKDPRIDWVGCRFQDLILDVCDLNLKEDLVVVAFDHGRSELVSADKVELDDRRVG